MLLGGAGLGVAGTYASYSVYHRYQEYRRLRALRTGTSDWDQSYYSDYYSTNQCQYGCPPRAHCEWGLCECNVGTTRRYGRCQTDWSGVAPDLTDALSKVRHVFYIF